MFSRRPAVPDHVLSSVKVGKSTQRDNPQLSTQEEHLCSFVHKDCGPGVIASAKYRNPTLSLLYKVARPTCRIFPLFQLQSDFPLGPCPSRRSLNTFFFFVNASSAVYSYYTSSFEGMHHSNYQN